MRSNVRDEILGSHIDANKGFICPQSPNFSQKNKELGVRILVNDLNQTLSPIAT
jgi:hypothetical protein